MTITRRSFLKGLGGGMASLGLAEALWQSPSWAYTVPAAKIQLLITPLLADQELVSESSTGVVYWEGAVDGKGRSRGQEVTCEGYVEMTGYAGSLAGFF